VGHRSLFSSIATSPALPAFALAVAIGIFLIDTLTPFGIAVAVLYIVVLILSANFLDRRGLIMVASVCAALTVLSYAVTHGEAFGSAFVRMLMSLAAIGVTTFLALENQATNEVLREQAGLLDVTHDAVFVRDLANKITYWNRAAADLYGWSAEDAIGNVTHVLLKTSSTVPLEQITAELLRNGRWEGELVHTKKDGTQVTVASRWSLQRDAKGQPIAVLETNNDITQEKRVEDALRRSEAYLAEAQRLSSTGSFGWDVAGDEIFWSSETYRIMEYPPGERPNLGWVRERTHPDDLARVEAMLARAQRAPDDWHIEHRLLMPDGSVKYLRVVAHAVRDASKHEFIGAIMDITANRQAENALIEARAELAHVNRVSTLGELAASIAHEVNQPIAAVVTNASAGLHWLRANPPNMEEVRSVLNRVVADGQRAGEVLGRIRSLVKKAPIRQGELDVNEAILEVVALTHSEVHRHSVQLHTNLASELPCMPGDRVQLQQVLLNLILNAVEAMNSGKTQRRELSISSERTPDGVLVSVADSGPGFDAEGAGRLFNAFYTTKAEGLGMGLAISRSIIEAHGGRLWATAREDQGALFQFSLPLENADFDDSSPLDVGARDAERA
jgi:PAS domain S-box-containing protein